METNDYGTEESLIPLLFVTAMIMGMLFGSYKLGRSLERRALTAALADTIQSVYMDGKTDGMAGCLQRTK